MGTLKINTEPSDIPMDMLSFFRDCHSEGFKVERQLFLAALNVPTSTVCVKGNP